MCISVDLPEPDGPGDRDELAGLDVDAGATQCADRDLADVVGLDEVANGYDWHEWFTLLRPAAGLRDTDGDRRRPPVPR